MRPPNKRASDLKYRENNRERILQQKREYYQRHKEKLKEEQNRKRLENIEEARAKGREFYRRNAKYNNALSKTYAQRNKELIRLRKIEKMYGVTKEILNNTMERQNGVCAICGEKNRNGRVLAVDHDHETGKFRGLLCSSCNRGLGYFRDRPDLLISASNYLIQQKE